jgi:HEAT repeat protein
MAELSAHSFAELRDIALNKAIPVERRIKACIALGGLALSKGLRPVLSLFRESDEKLVWAAADALIWIDGQAATPPLLRVLKRSHNPASRQAAIYALGFFRDVRAKELLIRIIRDHNETPYTRALAIEALAATSTARKAIDALIYAMKDESSYVRYTAALAITVEDPQARKALQAAVTDVSTHNGETIGKLARRRLQEWTKFSRWKRHGS